MVEDGPHIEEVEIHRRTPPAVQKQIIDAEVKNAKAGRLVGLVVVLLGAVLTLLGAAGAVDMRLGGLGLNARVANAGPGVVAMLIGLFIIWRTNLRIKVVGGK